MWYMRLIVADTGRVDVEDLLVEPALGRADLPDAVEPLVEVVALAWTGRVLEPLVVHHQAASNSEDSGD